MANGSGEPSTYRPNTWNPRPLRPLGARRKAAEGLDGSFGLLAAGHSVEHVTPSGCGPWIRTHGGGRDLIREYVYDTAACLTKSIIGRHGVIVPFARFLWNSIVRWIIDSAQPPNTAGDVLGRPTTSCATSAEAW